MANNPITLTDVFSGVESSLGIKSLTSEFLNLTEQLTRLHSLLAADPIQPTTRVPATNTSSSQSAPDLLGTLSSGFGQALGVSPLLAGLTRLLGFGGDTTTIPPLTRFTLPPRLDAIAGQSSQATDPFGAEYAQGNLARPIPGSQPQITVQIQAMDSRSILDRSQDIAQAVRLAMLESGVLTDVIREV